MATNAPNKSLGETKVGDQESSPLDAKTHEELRMLYAESTETLRFVKNHQWKTVGATLLVFFGLIAVAWMANADRAMASALMAITIVMGSAVIFTLIIYQFWMHNEMAKIDAINPHFSQLYRDVRSLKSRREGGIHRYTLLVFMFGVVIVGGIVVNLALERISGL